MVLKMYLYQCTRVRSDFFLGYTYCYFQLIKIYLYNILYFPLAVLLSYICVRFCIFTICMYIILLSQTSISMTSMSEGERDAFSIPY